MSDEGYYYNRRPPVRVGPDPLFTPPSLGVLKIATDGLWTVQHLSIFLDRLRRAYTILHVCDPDRFELLEENLDDDDEERQRRTRTRRDIDPLFEQLSGVFGNLRSGSKKAKMLQRTTRKVFDLLPMGEELLLRKISMQSPGWAEVVGQLNPLKAIQEFVVLARDWKASKEKLRLENTITKIEILKNLVGVMRDAGVGQNKIKEFVVRFVMENLKALEYYIDARLVIDAIILPLPEPPEERPAT